MTILLAQSDPFCEPCAGARRGVNTVSVSVNGVWGSPNQNLHGGCGVPVGIKVLLAMESEIEPGFGTKSASESMTGSHRESLSRGTRPNRQSQRQSLTLTAFLTLLWTVSSTVITCYSNLDLFLDSSPGP